VYPWESASDLIYQGNANAARVVVTCAEGSRARNAHVRLNVRDLLAPFTHELDRPVAVMVNVPQRLVPFGGVVLCNLRTSRQASW